MKREFIKFNFEGAQGIYYPNEFFLQWKTLSCNIACVSFELKRAIEIAMKRKI